MEETKKNYSIQLRLKKTTIEDAFVSVPVTKSIMIEKSDGTLGIDFEKFTKEAIQLSKNQNVEW